MVSQDGFEAQSDARGILFCYSRIMYLAKAIFSIVLPDHQMHLYPIQSKRQCSPPLNPNKQMRLLQSVHKV